MARKSENHQTGLFDEETPRVEPSPAQRVELAGLVETLLREIAEMLVDVRNRESVHEQDHG
jgi:hypothetical protein